MVTSLAPSGREASRILVVDDEQDEAEVLALLLGREGYDVQTAATGADALRAITERTPDLVLLDLHMPGMDGFELLSRLKQQPETAAVAVVVVSASSHESDVVRALERGATDYVSKPFAVEILLARVRAVLRSQREKDAIWALGEDLRQAQVELARTRRHAAIGAIAAALAHEINNPAAFVVTDLHEIRELAIELGEGGEDLASIADEALAGMDRIRDAVKDLSVFSAVADRRSLPSPEALDVVAVLRARASRFAGDARFELEGAESALVASGLAGEDELDALIGLLLRQAGAGAGGAQMRIVVERGVSERGEDVVVHIPSARAAEEDVALGITIARELAERFGGSLVHDERGWTLTLRAAG